MLPKTPFLIYLLLIVATIALIAIPIAAQVSVNEAIPPCSASDFGVLSDTMADFPDDYAAFSRGFIQMGLDGLETQLNEAHRLQTVWWSEIVPAFPRCAFAVEIAQLWGRALDEILIAVLLIDTERIDMADLHIVAGTELQLQIIELTDSLAQLIDD